MAAPLRRQPLDLMCRRLVGVLQADEHNNWSLAAATQRTGTTRMAGSELFSALAKAANSYDRVQKSASKTYSAVNAAGRTRKPRGKRGARTGTAGAQSAGAGPQKWGGSGGGNAATTGGAAARGAAARS